MVSDKLVYDLSLIQSEDERLQMYRVLVACGWLDQDAVAYVMQFTVPQCVEFVRRCRAVLGYLGEAVLYVRA